MLGPYRSAISIKDTQSVLKISHEVLTYQANLIRRLVGAEDHMLGIWLSTNQEIRTLNRDYRHKDKKTDILSFPFERLKPGQLHSHLPPEYRNLGDIVMSVPYILRHCHKKGMDVDAHIPRLLTHGIVHLLGYDHETDEEHEVMRAKEDAVLSEFWLKIALDAAAGTSRSLVQDVPTNAVNAKRPSQRTQQLTSTRSLY